jgi:hypothetical protein
LHVAKTTTFNVLIDTNCKGGTLKAMPATANTTDELASEFWLYGYG